MYRRRGNQAGHSSPSPRTRGPGAFHRTPGVPRSHPEGERQRWRHPQTDDQSRGYGEPERQRWDRGGLRALGRGSGDLSPWALGSLVPTLSLSLGPLFILALSLENYVCVSTSPVSGAIAQGWITISRGPEPGFPGARM